MLKFSTFLICSIFMLIPVTQAVENEEDTLQLLTAKELREMAAGKHIDKSPIFKSSAEFIQNMLRDVAQQGLMPTKTKPFCVLKTTLKSGLRQRIRNQLEKTIHTEPYINKALVMLKSQGIHSFVRGFKLNRIGSLYFGKTEPHYCFYW